MIILDAHQDIAYNYQSFGRDYTLPAYKKRRAEAGTPLATRPGRPALGLPDALLGRLALVFGTLFAMPHNRMLPNTPNPFVYRTPREAHDLALKQLEYYERLAGESEQVRWVRSQADLDGVLASWADDAPIGERQQGIVVSMEGADPIIEPKQFEEWYQRGVRAVGMAWRRTRYTGGTGEPGPLTPDGFELLDVLANTNTLLDLSHLSETAFYQSLERYEGPIIASHSNPRHFCNTDRHLSDDMIRALSERDGVMGVVTFNVFLHQHWRPGNNRSEVPFTRILDVIDHVCQVTGSAAHIGIGSDIDGGFGRESLPLGMDTVGDLWWIGRGLRRRGYAEADIEAVLSGNFIRKLRQALPR
ncbi:MAG: membrane dipeptidase [Chloroflexota bacterium]